MICPRLFKEINYELIVVLVWLMIFWVIIVLNGGVIFKQVVIAQAKGHVRVITLNNPHKLNIANREMVR
jgi:hypothetical protein